MTTPYWIITADGADQPISGPGLLMTKAPRIEAIAHSLAQINRFTGHANRPYSVAEHSVLVADIIALWGLGPVAQLAALMHDAHECLCGDVVSPVKAAMGVPWMELEHPLALQVRLHHGLQAAHTGYGKCIKDADLVALATERRDLTLFDARSNLAWPVLDTPGAQVPPLATVDLNTPAREAMSWRHHRDAFLQRYRTLQAQIDISPREAT